MRNLTHLTHQMLSKQRLMVSAIALSLSVIGLTGCSSMVAKITDSPVGVMPGDRTIAQRLRDSGIERNAKVNLYKLDSRFEKRSRVNVVSFHDAVLLTGQVPDPHLVKLASDSVKAIREVKVVHNELQVMRQSSYGDIVQDGVTKAAIRKNLLLLPYFHESRVKVEVERGVVYIMGKLSQAEVTRVLETVKKSDNILKIVSLVDIIDVNGRVIESVKPSEATSQSVGKLAIDTPKASENIQLAEQDKTPRVIVHPHQGQPKHASLSHQDVQLESSAKAVKSQKTASKPAKKVTVITRQLTDESPVTRPQTDK